LYLINSSNNIINILVLALIFCMLISFFYPVVAEAALGDFLSDNKGGLWTIVKGLLMFWLLNYLGNINDQPEPIN